jgi:hypothetical protein
MCGFEWRDVDNRDDEELDPAKRLLSKALPAVI